MNITAIVHVYYPERWSELAECLRNLGPEARLIVSYGEGNDKAVEEARRDFPAATFLKCENRGYDIWPFLKALKLVDFAWSDLIVKLHTKRNVDLPRLTKVGYTALNGTGWRDHLLSFAKTKEAWERTLSRFADGSVGLVGAREVIFKRVDAKRGEMVGSFDRARDFIRTNWRLESPKSSRFVGGTMFAVRASLYKLLADYPFTAEMFEVTKGHDTETFAHMVERLFGLIVSAQGKRVVGFNGSVTLRRLKGAILKFLYDNRLTERRHSIRVCGILVYRKKLSDD